MLRIAVVDDEAEIIRQMQEYLARYSEETRQEFQIFVFRDGSELLQDYEPRYDIILMDIEMPNVSGMDAAEAIRRVDENVVLVFITNMAQYAIRGYSVGALDFVMKPISYYTFSTKLGRAIQRAQRRRGQEILLPLPDGAVRLPVRQIYYVEVQNRILHYHTEQGVFQVRGTMQHAEEQLAAHHFVKCNHWYIVNLMHVQQVRKDVAVVAGHELEISRRSRAAFLAALTDYMGGNI